MMPSVKTRGGGPLETEILENPSKIETLFFYCKVVQMLEQAAYGDCKVSILGDTKILAGHGTNHRALAASALC